MCEQIQHHRPNAAAGKSRFEQLVLVMIEGFGRHVVPIGRGIQIQHVGMQVDDLEPGPIEMQQSYFEPGGAGFELKMIGKVNRQLEDVVFLPYRP